MERLKRGGEGVEEGVMWGVVGEFRGDLVVDEVMEDMKDLRMKLGGDVVDLR